MEVKVQLPSAATVVVPTTWPSTVMLTVVPGSPVPVMEGVLSVVVLAFAGPASVGVSGARPSMVKRVGVLSGEEPPAFEAETVAVR